MLARVPINAHDPPEVFEEEAKFLARQVEVIEQFATDVLNDFIDPDERRSAAEAWIKNMVAAISKGDETIASAFEKLAISRFRRQGVL
jgi:hypothetical protein